jgi:hypothetical protein
MDEGDVRFDKRVLQRNLRSGVVTRDEYQRYLKKLNDLSSDIDIFESRLMAGKKKVPRGVVESEEDEL